MDEALLLNTEVAVEARLGALRLSERLDLSYPDTHYVVTPTKAEVPYGVYGDKNKAKTLAFVTVPYGTSVDDASQQVRLFYQQTALGPEYCVIGVQIHDPDVARFSLKELVAIYRGDLRPMDDRVLSVIEDVQPRNDQAVLLYGFSLGGDVSVDLTYRTLTDENRGIVRIDQLGAWECARIANRGLVRLASALGKSGEKVYDNVLASASPALLKARGVDAEHSTGSSERRKHDKAMRASVLKYTLKDIKANIAGFKGFGRDVTLQQLNDIARNPELPATVIGRMTDSLVSTPEFAEAARQLGYYVIEMPGDHSTADNIKRSAQFVLLTTILPG